MINAKKSDEGILNQTPSTPYRGGNNASPGKRNNNCRDNERNIETVAFPIDWKNWVIMI